MAYKIRKLPQKKQKKTDFEDDKISVNRLEEEEKDGPVSVNRTLDDERAERSLQKNINPKKSDTGLENALNNMEYVQRLSNDDSDLAETFKKDEKNNNEEAVINSFESFDVSEIIDDDHQKTVSKGKVIPPAEDVRDFSLDAEPIDESDLGLPEDSFLLDRKVNKNDLYIQNESIEKQFLGSNVRKLRDFESLFKKGLSSKRDPKIDLVYEIDQNPILRKEIISEQLLRNFKSKDDLESKNARNIFIEMNLWDEEDFKDEIESFTYNKDDKNLIEKIKKGLS